MTVTASHADRTIRRRSRRRRIITRDVFGKPTANTRSTRSYDARNRLTAITHPAGTASESYSYFADGALHTASTTDGGTWTYAWNKRRLPTAETLTLGAKTFSIGYGYTGIGHLSTLTYPSGLTIGFNPNALGQPQQAGSYATGATYHPNGQLSGFTYGNNLIHSQTLNSRGLPSRISDRTSGNVSRLDYSYSYDKHANITSIVDGVNANENRALQYDARDRMTVATAANIYGEEIYDYDVLDNVRRMAVYPNGLGGYVQDYRYQYNASQRLTRIDNETAVQQWGFTHNGLGETLTRAGHSRNWSYQWNAAGRMTQGHLVYGGSTWETYVYDAHGHRTRATRNTGTTRHQIYTRTGQLLYTEDTKDNQRIDYIHLGGKLVAQRSRPLSTTTATVTYHHTDSIQSANVETNTAGTQTYRTVRMPYGSPYNGVYREGPGFGGHVTDTQTNLTYMQQRYYDPVALRFLSTDPVDVSTTNGSNFNRYWYANNNPYRHRDPDGRFAQLIWGGIAGAAVEVFVQTAVEGRSFSDIDVSNVVVAAGAGAATGGIASAAALSAARGTVTVGAAVVRTSAGAGVTGAAASVVEDVANGESPSGTKALVEGTAAAIGGGVGSRATLAPVATLEAMSAKGGLSATVSDTTRGAIIGSDKSVISAATSSAGARAGGAANTAIEATKAKVQDDQNR